MTDPQVAETRRDKLRNAADTWANPPANVVVYLPRYSGPRDTPKDKRKRGTCEICHGYHEMPATHFPYMGHADVTLALIDIDPAWSWEPCSYDETGSPQIVAKNGRLILWGWLTIHGVRRLAVGTCDSTKNEPEKELVGDLLRNGAMRFGVGTALWSKAEIHDQEDELDTPAPAPAPAETPRKQTGTAATKTNPTDNYVESAVLKLRCNKLNAEQQKTLLERWPLNLTKPMHDRIPPNLAAQLERVLDEIENPEQTADAVNPDPCATCGTAATCPLPPNVAETDPQCRHYQGEEE